MKALRIVGLLILTIITTISLYIIVLGIPKVPMLLPVVVFSAGTVYALIISVIHQEVFEE